MHHDHATFLEALAKKRILSVRFVSRKDGRELVKQCAPLDYGPLRGATDGLDRYHLWDLEEKRRPFNLPLLEGDIQAMTMLDASFDPATIITWAFKPNAWKVERDWGPFS